MDKFTPEYIQNVQQIIKNDEKDKARELLKDLHPADIAELYQQLNLDEAEYIYMLLDGEKAADVLLELDEDDREKMLKQLPSEVIAKQFIRLHGFRRCRGPHSGNGRRRSGRDPLPHRRRRTSRRHR